MFVVNCHHAGYRFGHHWQMTYEWLECSVFDASNSYNAWDLVWKESMENERCQERNTFTEKNGGAKWLNQTSCSIFICFFKYASNVLQNITQLVHFFLIYSISKLIKHFQTLISRFAWAFPTNVGILFSENWTNVWDWGMRVRPQPFLFSYWTPEIHFKSTTISIWAINRFNKLNPSRDFIKIRGDNCIPFPFTSLLCACADIS